MLHGIPVIRVLGIYKLSCSVLCFRASHKDQFSITQLVSGNRKPQGLGLVGSQKTDLRLSW